MLTISLLGIALVEAYPYKALVYLKAKVRCWEYPSGYAHQFPGLLIKKGGKAKIEKGLNSL